MVLCRNALAAPPRSPRGRGRHSRRLFSQLSGNGTTMLFQKTQWYPFDAEWRNGNLLRQNMLNLPASAMVPQWYPFLLLSH